MSDAYVEITATLNMATRDAFLINSDRWIPFALVTIIDERKIKTAMRNVEIKFNLREWKAMELDLL